MQHKDQEYISLKEMGKFIDKSMISPPQFSLCALLHKRAGAQTAMHALSVSSTIFEPKVLLLCMSLSGSHFRCKKEDAIAVKRLQHTIAKLYDYENINVKLTIPRSDPTHMCFFISVFNLSTDNNREKFLLVSDKFKDLVRREFRNKMISMLHVNHLVTRFCLTTSSIPLEKIAPLITKLEHQMTHGERLLSGPTFEGAEVMTK